MDAAPDDAQLTLRHILSAGRGAGATPWQPNPEIFVYARHWTAHTVQIPRVLRTADQQTQTAQRTATRAALGGQGGTAGYLDERRTPAKLYEDVVVPRALRKSLYTQLRLDATQPSHTEALLAFATVLICEYVRMRADDGSRHGAYDDDHTALVAQALYKNALASTRHLCAAADLHDLHSAYSPLS